MQNSHNYWQTEQTQNNAAKADTKMQETQTFTDRSDAFEHYRATIDAYRLSAAICDTFGVDPKATEPGEEPAADVRNYWAGVVYSNKENDWGDRGTKRVCQSLDGTLGEYRDAFPEPDPAVGVLLPEAVAKWFGIDYDEQDSITVPVINGEPATFPLPNGKTATVQGVVGGETETETDSIPEPAPEPRSAPVENLKLIGPKSGIALREAGINTVDDFMAAPSAALLAVAGVGEKTLAVNGHDATQPTTEAVAAPETEPEPEPESEPASDLAAQKLALLERMMSEIESL